MSPVWIVLALLPILGGAERFNCRGRILGAYYADAKSGCKAFHVCVRVAGGGIRDFRFFCPPGTLFHQEAQTCTDWGDDDPLACPADIYDGQFDLYKIGSVYDTKKVSSSSNREDESEYGLQRAETGDRRLPQNSQSSNVGASDLRTAHSSDFFSGQRDRGRDDPIPQSNPSISAANNRQSFRRPTTTTQLPTTQPASQVKFSSQYITNSQYNQPKRKAIRKRPIYDTTTAANTEAPQNTYQPQSFSEQPDYFRKQKVYSDQPKQDFSRKQQENYYEKPKQEYSQLAQNDVEQQKQDFNRQTLNYSQKQKQDIGSPQSIYNEQSKPDFNRQIQNNPEQQKEIKSLSQSNFKQPTQNINQQASFVNSQVPPNIDLPLKYHDEYVEVTRVSPKNNNRYYPNSPSSTAYFSSTQASVSDGQKSLVELYNYNGQSTPGIKSQNENRPFKVRNSFNVQPNELKESDFSRTRNSNYNVEKGSSTAGIDQKNSRGTSTPSYRNFNSVSYEPEKNNYVDISSARLNYFNGISTTPITTTIFTTTRFEPLSNVNTIAYNTNIGFDAYSPNYSESIEDDGQYRPPQGEDDGQYRPELYERESELLTGAHSLNIAASNRLPEEHKQSKIKTEKSHSKTAVPAPFRPVPTPFTTSTTHAPETYPTTLKPRKELSTPRNFDYFQTYTTTSRPYDLPSAPEYTFIPASSPPPSPKVNTESVSKPTNKPSSRATSVPINEVRSTRPPQFAKAPNKKEDSSYDYAYYDSDPGFSEYDHIEEFGKTKSKL